MVGAFIPTMSSASRTSQSVYFSVFADIGDKKYYSRLGRVVVAYDRDKMSFKCDCSSGTHVKCIHQKICLTVVESHDEFTMTRPENVANDSEVEKAARSMDYILNKKCLRIPLDMQECIKQCKHKIEFCPTEIECAYCGSHLEISHVNERGHLFTMHKKIRGVKITTKKCSNIVCKAEYRYSDFTEGYFNYNNSTVYEVQLMEYIVGSWEENIPLKSSIRLLSHITTCLLYTSPSPRDGLLSRMPSSA